LIHRREGLVWDKKGGAMQMFSMEMISEGIYYHNDLLLLQTFVNLHEYIYIYIPNREVDLEIEISFIKKLIDFTRCAV
jgi:hypothetical protein